MSAQGFAWADIQMDRTQCSIAYLFSAWFNESIMCVFFTICKYLLKISLICYRESKQRVILKQQHGEPANDKVNQCDSHIVFACVHKHIWLFHLYKQFSWLIKMQPD